MSYRRRVVCRCLALGRRGGAFEIEHSETRYVDKRYQCDLNVRLDAPLDKVEAVLRDYEKYPSLDTRILQARVLERPSPNVAMLETKLRLCLGWFCRNVSRVERVEESEHALAATADPSRSDVKYGETPLAACAGEHGSTLVTYPPASRRRSGLPRCSAGAGCCAPSEDATTDLFMNVEMKAKRTRGKKKRPATEVASRLMWESG
jgi:hypothetical protein